MKIAMLSPIAWRTPPRHYGPWESVVSLLCEGLAERGIDVSLFATTDSCTKAKLIAVSPRGYEEDASVHPKVWECLHISEVFERASEFDLIHNQFDFLPLTYSGLVDTPVVTTIHGFSSPQILPVYEKYDKHTYYVSISNADRSEKLSYIRTVYHGIDLRQFAFNAAPNDYLLFFGRIHPDKGTVDAIEIARRAGRKLIMAGIIQDTDYFRAQVEPKVDGDHVEYIGSVGPTKRNEVLRQAHALLHPIYFDEPFGLSIVEAMACGTPVIAYQRGSMAEIITDGRTGFLVDEDIDQAVLAIDQVKEIDRRACRDEVEARFSVDRMVDEYIDVYREILGLALCHS